MFLEFTFRGTLIDGLTCHFWHNCKVKQNWEQDRTMLWVKVKKAGNIHNFIEDLASYLSCPSQKLRIQSKRQKQGHLLTSNPLILFLPILCNNLMNTSIKMPGNKDKLSSIQTSLHDMKEEVDQYLKKTNIDSVPPVLKARNYLLLNYMQSLKKKDTHTERSTIKKDLSSQKLGNAMDGDRFEPLRQSSTHQSEDDQKVKHKRSLSGSSNKLRKDFILPNIGPVKLDFEEKIFTCRNSRNSKLQGKSLQINQERQDQFLKVRRYLKEENNPQKDGQGRNVSSRLAGSISRRLFDALDRQYSRNSNDHHLSFSHELPFNIPDIVEVNESKARMREEKERINSKMSEQRKQSFFTRRNLIKSISKREQPSNELEFKKYESSLTPRKPSKQSKHRPRNLEKNQCSPWQQTQQTSSFYIQPMQF